MQRQKLFLSEAIDNYLGSVHTLPEKRLILAVLERAFCDYLNLENINDHWGTAYSWIFDDSLRKWGYRWCLMQVDLDEGTECIRQALRKSLDEGERFPEIRFIAAKTSPPRLPVRRKKRRA